MFFNRFKKDNENEENGQALINEITEENLTINKETKLLIHNQGCIVEKISNRIEETGFATENLIDIINEISKNIDNQSQSINKVVCEIEEFSALTQQMYASTLDSQKIAQETMASAHEGNLATDKSISAMNEIESSVGYIRTVVKSLSNETAQIDGMLNIIKDITKQTNLLSLNAAIEAARAGEHGRGFAVVADEVSKLAKKSQESVEVISNTISRIKDSIDKTIETMDESSVKVNHGVSIANDTVKVFSKIVETISNSNEITTEINTAIANQTKSLDEIILSTQNMNEVTEKIMSSTEIALMNANYTKSSLHTLSNTSSDLNSTTDNLLSRIQKGDDDTLTIRTFIDGDVENLDPAMVFDQGSIRILDCINIGLLISGSSSNIMPGVAKSWYVEEDNLTWVFNLRKGAKFHNGKEITAQDVKYSLERLLNPSLKSPNSWFLHPIEGATEYNEGKSKVFSGIKILDRYRISIKLTSPYSGFLLNLAQPCCSILDSEDLKRNKFTGCGPYIIEDKDEQKYIFKAFNEYLGGKAYVERLDFVYNDEKYLENFIDGKYDFLILSGYNTVNELSKFKNKISINKQDVMTTQFAGFNLRKNSIFAKDKTLRKAINYAINKNKIINEVTNNLATESKGVFPPAILDNKHLSGFSYDLNKAKKLLLDSSYNNEVLKILGTERKSEQKSSRDKIIDYLIEDLNALGVRVEVVRIPSDKYMKAESIEKCDVYFMGWIADTGDPDNYLEPLFNPNNYTNFCGYDNSEVTELMDESKKILNPTRRTEMYKKIQDIIIDDAPWIFLFHPQTVYANRHNVKNVKINTLNRLRYEDIIIDSINE